MTHDPYDLEDVYVGDSGPVIEVSPVDFDLYTIRPLTGYSAYVRFWNVGASATHVVWPCTVDAVNNLITYEPRGVEYPSAGVVHVQFTLTQIDWTATAVGWGFLETSSALLRRRVLARPA